MPVGDVSSCEVDQAPAPDPALPMPIAELAECRLRANSYLALRNVACDFADGVLTLRGCLPKYYLKQVAQAVVSRIPGVGAIVNDIQVGAGGSERNADREFRDGPGRSSLADLQPGSDLV